jgi:hypothetical protein
VDKSRNGLSEDVLCPAVGGELRDGSVCLQLDGLRDGRAIGMLFLDRGLLFWHGMLGRRRVRRLLVLSCVPSLITHEEMVARLDTDR